MNLRNLVIAVVLLGCSFFSIAMILIADDNMDNMRESAGIFSLAICGIILIVIPSVGYGIHFVYNKMKRTVIEDDFGISTDEEYAEVEERLANMKRTRCPNPKCGHYNSKHRHTCKVCAHRLPRP